MKSLIKKVADKGEQDGKYGKQYSFIITYIAPDGSIRTAYYTSKKPTQDTFIEGKECEFNEEERTSKAGATYHIVKPMYNGNYKSGYGKNLQKEQARYSGFAVSYVKDMIVAGKVEPDQWHTKSKEVFNWMVEMDNTLKS